MVPDVVVTASYGTPAIHIVFNLTHDLYMAQHLSWISDDFWASLCFVGVFAVLLWR